MRLSALFLLPVASAFAPPSTNNVAVRSPLFRPEASLVQDVEPIRDFTSQVSNRLEDAMDKVDDVVGNRLMRFVNYSPIVITLSGLLNHLGSTKFGLDVAPSALKMASPAGLGAIPTWVGYALPVAIVTQVAAVLRSSLADSDEMSQEDISAVAVSNFCLTRALSQASLTNWAIAAVASGYYARKHGNQDPSVNNLSIQITSSLASVATVLGVAAQLPRVVPLLQGQEQATALVGLLAYLGLAGRDGNGTVKKVINACVIGGVLVSKVAGGALNVNKLLRVDTVVTAALAYVAALSIDRARSAVMD